MNDCYVETNIGILADPPGTGKTLTVVGLICRNKQEWDVDEPEVIKQQIMSNMTGTIRIMQNITLKRLQTTLIVVPL